MNHSNKELDFVASVLGWALVIFLLCAAIVADCATNQARGNVMVFDIYDEESGRTIEIEADTLEQAIEKSEGMSDRDLFNNNRDYDRTNVDHSHKVDVSDITLLSEIRPTRWDNIHRLQRGWQVALTNASTGVKTWHWIDTGRYKRPSINDRLRSIGIENNESKEVNMDRLLGEVTIYRTRWSYRIIETLLKDGMRDAFYTDPYNDTNVRDRLDRALIRFRQAADTVEWFGVIDNIVWDTFDSAQDQRTREIEYLFTFKAVSNHKEILRIPVPVTISELVEAIDATIAAAHPDVLCDGWMTKQRLETYNEEEANYNVARLNRMKAVLLLFTGKEPYDLRPMFNLVTEETK